MFLRNSPVLLFSAVVYCVVSQSANVIDFTENWNGSCDVWDTVNISDAIQLSNGSYLQNGILYPEKYVGLYQYEFLNQTVKVSANSHLRGCICKIVRCIRLCCPVGQHLKKSACKTDIMDVKKSVNVTRINGDVEEVNLNKEFAFVFGKPCPKMYSLNPAKYEYDDWTLFENGSMLRMDDGTFFSKIDSCFSPTESGSASELVFNPFVCPIPVQTTRNAVYGFAMLISMPFLILTIIVYLVTPKLRNLHGKALCCYLACLVVGYACLGYTLTEGGIIVDDPKCKLLGYTAYFSFLSSFFWLSTISFDLWMKFRTMTPRGQKPRQKQFIIYSIYAWGLALFFTGFVWLIQKSNIPETYKPGMGISTCWIDSGFWNQMIYFYGTVLVIIIFNTGMFMSTVIKINKISRETSKIIGNVDSKRDINRKRDSVLLFFRLFIVMGITWLADIASCLVGKRFEFLFYATDVCNAAQGPIIFILFAKPKVMQMISAKYQCVRSGKKANWSNSQNSTASLTLSPSSP